MTILECCLTNVNLLGEAPPKLVAIANFDFEGGHSSVCIEVITFHDSVFYFALTREPFDGGASLCTPQRKYVAGA